MKRKKLCVILGIVLLVQQIQPNFLDGFGNFAGRIIGLDPGFGQKTTASPVFPSAKSASLNMQPSLEPVAIATVPTHFPGIVTENAIAHVYIEKNTPVRNISLNVHISTNLTGSANRVYSLMQGTNIQSVDIETVLSNASVNNLFDEGVFLVPYMTPVQATQEYVAKDLTNSSTLSYMNLAVYDSKWNLLGYDKISLGVEGTNGGSGALNFSPGSMSLSMSGASILHQDLALPTNVFHIQAVDQLPDPLQKVSAQAVPTMYQVAKAEEGQSKDISVLLLSKKNLTKLFCNVVFRQKATTRTSAEVANDQTVTGVIELTSSLPALNKLLDKGPLLLNVETNLNKNNQEGYVVSISVYQNGQLASVVDSNGTSLLTNPIVDVSLTDANGNLVPASAVMQSVNFTYMLYGQSSYSTKDLGSSTQCALIQSSESIISGSMLADGEIFSSLEAGFNFKETAGYNSYVATIGLSSDQLKQVNAGVKAGKEITVTATLGSGNSATLSVASTDNSVNISQSQVLTDKNTKVVNVSTNQNTELPSEVVFTTASVGYQTNNMNHGILIPSAQSYIFKTNLAASIVGEVASSTPGYTPSKRVQPSRSRSSMPNFGNL